MPDKQKNQISDGNLEQANVSEEFKLEVDRLLNRNRDLFVSEDKYLDKIDSVGMCIDTGTHDLLPKKMVSESHTAQNIEK